MKFRMPLIFRRRSVRIQLITWNIITLALLLGVLGLFIHYLNRSFILTSVDHELENRIRPFDMGLPAPPPGQQNPNNSHPPGNPPFQQGAPPTGMPNMPSPLGQQNPNNTPAPGISLIQQGAPKPGMQDGQPSNAPAFLSIQNLPHRRANERDNDKGSMMWMLKGMHMSYQPRQMGRPYDPASHYRPRLFYPDGRPFFPGSQETPWDPEGLALVHVYQKIFRSVTVNGEQLRVISLRFPPFGSEAGVVQAAYPLTDVNQAIAGLDKALLALLPVALLCAGLGGYLLTNRALLSVSRLAHAAENIGGENISERLPVSGQDEFARLAGTFNSMLDRLELAFQEQQKMVQQQRRFTADASHELRTPLTIIKANAGLCLDKNTSQDNRRQSLVDIDQAANSMSRLVQDLLLLARSDDGQLGRKRIELPIREALESASQKIRQRTRASLILDIPDPALTVFGNEDEIIRLFTNLLDNAARYTPDGGIIRVKAVRDKNIAEVTVADTGTGIAPEHLPRLGERFYRVDQARSRPEGGTGLGLSICKGIVEAHQGSMTIESVVNSGTFVTVRLPVEAVNMR
jgi:signal transduction histidine kinase